MKQDMSLEVRKVKDKYLQYIKLSPPPFPIPDKRRFAIAFHRQRGIEMGGDVLIAITSAPVGFVNDTMHLGFINGRRHSYYGLFLWLVMENGDYKFWGQYEPSEISSSLEHSRVWTLKYEFSRVLVEKRIV